MAVAGAQPRLGDVVEGALQDVGGDYRTYRKNVPGWIPNLKPWSPPDDP